MTLRPSILLFALVLAAGAAEAPRAYAQGAEFFKSSKKKSNSNANNDNSANDSNNSGNAGNAGNGMNAQEGLESATPTDNVNELNGDSGPPPAKEGGNNEMEDFPVNDSKDFDGDSGGSGGGNSNSLFDDSAPPANDTAKTPALNPASAPANTPSVAPNGTPPANTPPPTLNANVKPPDNAGAPPNDAAAGNNATKSNAVPAAAVTAPETPPPPPGPPDIEAPPLPPPNEFAGAPPVPGTMRQMAEGEAPEEYTVEPGDTLFDICDQLLDEPSYWPKLWALNPEIKNPHFIFPNMRLRFYPGDDDNPPYLQVVTEDDVIPIDKGDLDEEDLIAEKVIFPVDVNDEAPIEVIGPEQVDALEDGIINGGRRYSGTEVAVQVPGFIFPEDKEALGTVLGGRNDEVALPDDMLVDIQGTGDLSNGTLYTVLRKGQAAVDPVSGDELGTFYYFVANVRIERELENDVRVGKTQDPRLAVQADDIVVNFISTRRMVPLDTAAGAFASTEASIVGFGFDWQEIGGRGDFAFIDKGSSDGIAQGQNLPIYSTPDYLSKSFGHEDLPTDYQNIGYIRIIDTTEAGSVGIIMRNTVELKIGDRTYKNDQ